MWRAWAVQGSFERKVFAVKRDIAQLRQSLGSQREIVHRIGRGDFPAVTRRLCMSFREVYDHLYRATEMLDTLRDLSMASESSARSTSPIPTCSCWACAAP